ncbi:unnamed protein product [Protopolystoma xenopodis]|uniref:Uncharacterized protein n=1 Tax=Protopolystoma xenopodis TaxID=117903 RepID=A0A3S4ZIF2_9PLAT|nr:unnamed protein product [Protopolystoma xenopodis]
MLQLYSAHCNWNSSSQPLVRFEVVGGNGSAFFDFLDPLMPNRLILKPSSERIIRERMASASAPYSFAPDPAESRQSLAAGHLLTVNVQAWLEAAQLSRLLVACSAAPSAASRVWLDPRLRIYSPRPFSLYFASASALARRQSASVQAVWESNSSLATSLKTDEFVTARQLVEESGQVSWANLQLEAISGCPK